jgi:hypothetical protein
MACSDAGAGRPLESRCRFLGRLAMAREKQAPQNSDRRRTGVKSHARIENLQGGANPPCTSMARIRQYMEDYRYQAHSNASLNGRTMAAPHGGAR